MYNLAPGAFLDFCREVYPEPKRIGDCVHCGWPVYEGDECLVDGELWHCVCADEIASHIDDSRDPGIPVPGR